MSVEQITFELTLPSQLGYEKLVRPLIAWLGQRLHFTAARTADIQTAVSEACINAIEHGNQGDTRLQVRVLFTVTHSHLEVVVMDAGISIYREPGTPPPSIHEKVTAGASPRGLGLMLMRQLVDEFEFLAPAPGHGNRFCLRFSRPAAA